MVSRKCMQVNPEKNQYLALSSTCDTILELKLNYYTIIESEPYVQALGVYIDSKVNFSQHISVVCKKAAI